MYRQRIEHTAAKSAGAQRLQRALLSYHDQQLALKASPLLPQRMALSAWQSARLRQTHDDLHQNDDFRPGLEFLLSDLYAPQDFSARDNNLERIFPKLVKYLPDKVLHTIAQLVELNLQTQMLDQQLAHTLFDLAGDTPIQIEAYCTAYRACDNAAQRLHQIEQIGEAGLLLDRYARSTFLLYSLKLAEGAAEMAGLAALHAFLMRGFEAFHQMQDVPTLMETLAQRETTILHRIYHQHPNPFDLPESSQPIEIGKPVHV